MSEDWPIAWEADEALTKTRPNRSSRRGAHYVYLIASTVNRLKIGHSASPRGRVSELQVGSPVGLTLVRTWKTTREAAKLMEREMHQAFAWGALHGEWFDVPGPAVLTVGDLFAKGQRSEAVALADLVRRIEENEKAERDLRNAWYGPGSRIEKRAAETAAKAALPGVRRAAAALWLEAFDLGYTGTVGERTQSINQRRAWYERLIAEHAEPA